MTDQAPKSLTPAERQRRLRRIAVAQRDGVINRQQELLRQIATAVPAEFRQPNLVASVKRLGQDALRAHKEFEAMQQALDDTVAGGEQAVQFLQSQNHQLAVALQQVQVWLGAHVKEATEAEALGNTPEVPMECLRTLHDMMTGRA